MPSDYVCRQTMVNSSRFITSDLKSFEQKALHAEQKIKSLEYEIFCKIREEIRKYTHVLRELAFDISNLDALHSLAKAAIVTGAHGLIIEIHPDPEKALSDGPQTLNFENFKKLSKELEKLSQTLILLK